MISREHALMLTLLISISLLLTMMRGSQIEPFGSRLRIIFGSIVVFFLPGRRITQAAFADKEIDGLETIALSFAFSLSVVPLLVFYGNLLGFAITQRLVIIVVFAIIMLSYGRIEWKKK